MRAERRAYLLIVGSRALSEAVGLAAVAALVHAVGQGRDPIPLLPASFVLFGVTLVLVAVLAERGTVRQSAVLVVAAVAGWSAWGLVQPARAPDALAVLARLIAFGGLGELYVWRALGIARGLQRWREVRSDALLALLAVVLAALVPGPIDHGALPALGLAVACSGAVALSLARSAEELSLSTGQVRARPTGSSAMGTAFALGLLAIATGIALPWAERLVASAARALGPLLGDLVFVLLLPLGYVAAYLVGVVFWLRERLRLAPIALQPPPSPFDPEADAARIKELEQLRTLVVGAYEAIAVVVALVAALVLISRLVQARRARLAEGTSLERETVDGIGLRATLRGLVPKRAPRRRPPADDGSAGAALRRLYWRLLEVAEREGPGWRAPAETPAEHEARLAAAAARWRDAAPLVRAFEAVRYGEREPDRATLDRARDALRRVEAAR